MAAQAEAERQRRAKVISAEGELQVMCCVVYVCMALCVIVRVIVCDYVCV